MVNILEQVVKDFLPGISVMSGISSGIGFTRGLDAIDSHYSTIENREKIYSSFEEITPELTRVVENLFPMEGNVELYTGMGFIGLACIMAGVAYKTLIAQGKDIYDPAQKED